jgi:hypothetical protein
LGVNWCKVFPSLKRNCCCVTTFLLSLAFAFSLFKKKHLREQLKTLPIFLFFIFNRVKCIDGHHSCQHVSIWSSYLEKCKSWPLIDNVIGSLTTHIRTIYTFVLCLVSCIYLA